MNLIDEGEVALGDLVEGNDLLQGSLVYHRKTFYHYLKTFSKYEALKGTWLENMPIIMFI